MKEIFDAIINLTDTVQELIDKEYILIGKVIDTDYTGEKSYVDYYPVVKVNLVFSEEIESHWIRLATPVSGDKQGDWLPVKVGDEVLVAVPQGNLDYAVVITSLRGYHKLPDEFKNDANGYWRGFRWGELLIAYSKEPDKHKIIIKHSNGYEYYFDEDKKEEYKHFPDGAFYQYNYETHNLTISLKNVNITIDENGNVTGTMSGNLNLDIGGNENVNVNGNINYTANGEVYIKGLKVRIKSDTEILLEIDGQTLSGIITQLTHPHCYLTGIPIGSSLRVKGDA